MGRKKRGGKKGRNDEPWSDEEVEAPKQAAEEQQQPQQQSRKAKRQAKQQAKQQAKKQDSDSDSDDDLAMLLGCLLYTSPSPRDRTRSRMPSSA